MKRAFLPAIIIAALLSNANAQSNRAYAVTAATKGNYNWNVVREIDLASGQVVRTIFDPAVNKSVSFTGAAGAKVNPNTSLNSPTANGVAATAYDAKNNRLYFSPMWGNDLRYFDLNTNTSSVVVNEDARYSTGPRVDESNVVTRMAFGSDGNGYALTNDGNQLIRFTTDQKPVITNLGALIDSKSNNGISVHAQCTSWGGDMIADAFGNLYLFTYKSHVFKINPNTLVAEYVGAVKNLPAAFTTNGAAVDANGDVLITSAIGTENYYKVNLATLTASPIDNNGETVYNASDLANSNLAYATKTTNVVKSEIKGNGSVSIYPNPAISKFFNVQFEKLPAGKYNVVLTDANGRSVVNQNINVNGLQNEKINLPKAAAAGLYMIKITDSEGKGVYNDKIVVQ